MGAKRQFVFFFTFEMKSVTQNCGKNWASWCKDSLSPLQKGKKKENLTHFSNSNWQNNENGREIQVIWLKNRPMEDAADTQFYGANAKN